jgi:hypothetical protein
MIEDSRDRKVCPIFSAVGRDGSADSSRASGFGDLSGDFTDGLNAPGIQGKGAGDWGEW